LYKRPKSAQPSISAAHSDTNWDIALSSYAAAPAKSLERGTDLKTIQMQLGHFDLETTTIYLHLSHGHLQSVNNPIEALAISGLGDKPSLRPSRTE